MICEHPDEHVRLWPTDSDLRALACGRCGRLFGHLTPDEEFRAYNPPRGLAPEDASAEFSASRHSEERS